MRVLRVNRYAMKSSENFGCLLSTASIVFFDIEVTTLGSSAFAVAMRTE